MTKNATVGVVGFIGGAVLGLAAWWILWSPLVTYLSLVPEPWEVRDGSLVVNDLFAAIGKVATLFVFPGVAGAQVASYARDRYGA